MRKRTTNGIVLTLSLWLMPVVAQAQSRILASTPILEDIARQLNCSPAPFPLASLMPRNTDPHSFFLTPQAMLQLKSQTHLIVVGKNYESWYAKFKSAPGTKVLVLSDELNLKSDPHFWHSSAKTALAAEKIAKFLATAPGIPVDSLTDCLRRYQQSITAAHTELLQLIATIPESRRAIATNHDALGYFGEEYGIRIQSLLGLSTDEKPSPEALRRLTTELKAKKAHALFLESGSSAREIESVARSARLTIGGTLYVDMLTEGAPASSILEMWSYNMKTIVAALAVSPSKK